MDTRKRILQANVNNQGGAFSVAYEAQKKLQEEYIFDYFFPDPFIENDVYRHLLSMGSRCEGKLECKTHILKQYEIYRAFRNYLCENRYEYVHIHSDTAWKVLIYYLAAKKTGIGNIVVHSHSGGINGHYKVLNYLLHLLARPVISRARYRCACSDIAARWMFGTEKNVQIILNGVDTEKYRFRAGVRKSVREILAAGNRIVIGTVSDFSPQKNPEFLFEIIKSFKNHPGYLFLLVGNRRNCRLKELIDKDGTFRNVIFAGTVTNVQDYLSAMDIFILPSRFEGLPMCALEAQVNGLYTIISDKITPQTQCSKYFERLKPELSVWKKAIENAVLCRSRENPDDFLNAEKADSSRMAAEFRKLYTGGAAE